MLGVVLHPAQESFIHINYTSLTSDKLGGPSHESPEQASCVMWQVWHDKEYAISTKQRPKFAARHRHWRRV